jgi:hypothetical protein
VLARDGLVVTAETVLDLMLDPAIKLTGADRSRR